MLAKLFQNSVERISFSSPADPRRCDGGDPEWHMLPKRSDPRTFKKDAPLYQTHKQEKKRSLTDSFMTSTSSMVTEGESTNHAPLAPPPPQLPKPRCARILQACGSAGRFKPVTFFSSADTSSHGALYHKSHRTLQTCRAPQPTGASKSRRREKKKK
jgi:hypothetical protein